MDKHILKPGQASLGGAATAASGKQPLQSYFWLSLIAVIVLVAQDYSFALPGDVKVSTVKEKNGEKIISTKIYVHECISIWGPTNREAWNWHWAGISFLSG